MKQAFYPVSLYPSAVCLFTGGMKQDRDKIGENSARSGGVALIAVQGSAMVTVPHCTTLISRCRRHQLRQ